MYTPQQTAKPLSAYDSYIQQSLATREALRVKPHSHTPRNEPLPPAAGISSNEEINATAKQAINTNPVKPETETSVKHKVISKPDAVIKDATTAAFAVSSYIPARKRCITHHINTISVFCRGGPVE